MDIISILNQMNSSAETKKVPAFPKKFIKKQIPAEKAETSKAAEERANLLQKPVTALSNVLIFELTHDSRSIRRC